MSNNKTIEDCGLIHAMQEKGIARPLITERDECTGYQKSEITGELCDTCFECTALSYE